MRVAPGRLAVEAVEPGGEEQVLHRAELLEEGRVHADPVDQALDGHLVALDVVAEDLDPALVEGQESGDQPDERRLARAVGAQDPVDVAALEAHRHVRDRGHRLALPPDDEPLADVLDEERRHGGSLRSAVAGPAGSIGPGEPFFSSGVRVAVTVVLQVDAVEGRRGDAPLGKTRKPRVRLDVLRRRVGLAAAGVDSSPEWAEGNKIAVGPDLAHGSWFVRKAVLPPAV